MIKLRRITKAGKNDTLVVRAFNLIVCNELQNACDSAKRRISTDQRLRARNVRRYQPLLWKTSVTLTARVDAKTLSNALGRYKNSAEPKVAASASTWWFVHIHSHYHVSVHTFSVASRCLCISLKITGINNLETNTALPSVYRLVFSSCSIIFLCIVLCFPWNFCIIFVCFSLRW
jgi:hypothetical protein